jgi:hypothetical protein
MGDLAGDVDELTKLFIEEQERGNRRALEQLRQLRELKATTEARFDSLEAAVDHIIKHVEIPTPDPPPTSPGSGQKAPRSRAQLSVVKREGPDATSKKPPEGRRRANPGKPSPSKPKKPRPKK